MSTMADACAWAFIQEWVCRFGVPHEITSERGAQFTSSLWGSIARLLGMELHHTSAYHLQSNGLVERFHRTLKASLHARLREPPWTDELPWVLLGLRTAPKADSPHSPAELALRYVPLLSGELIRQEALTSPPPLTPIHHHGGSSPAEVPALATAEYAFIRVDAHRNPLQPPYRRLSVQD